MPSREAAYRNLVLNQRIDQRTPLIARAVWEACAGEADLEELRTGVVFVGLDLSARNDLTALVTVVRDLSGVWHWFPEFFAPLEQLRERSLRDRAPYDVWHQQGFLTATPGASVDYEIVARRLCELCDDFDVQAIAFDRWRIDVLQRELQRLDRELPLKPFGQGFKDMSPALDTVESELLNGRIRHGAHPVLTWNAANAVATRDPAGNRKLDKMKARGRIDGLVAATMAMGLASQLPAALPSVYESRGLTVL